MYAHSAAIAPQAKCCTTANPPTFGDLQPHRTICPPPSELQRKRPRTKSLKLHHNRPSKMLQCLRHVLDRVEGCCEKLWTKKVGFSSSCCDTPLRAVKLRCGHDCSRLTMHRLEHPSLLMGVMKRAVRSTALPSTSP